MVALVKYMGPYRRGVLLGTAFAIAGTVLALIAPEYLSQLTDGIFSSISSGSKIDMDWVFGIGLTLIVIYGLYMIFSLGNSYIIGETSNRIGDKLRKDISRKFFRLPMSYLETHMMGDSISLITNDSDSIRTMSGESISALLNAAVSIIGATVMMFVIEWRLALFAVLPTFAGIIGMYAVAFHS